MRPQLTRHDETITRSWRELAVVLGIVIVLGALSTWACLGLG